MAESDKIKALEEKIAKLQDQLSDPKTKKSTESAKDFAERLKQENDLEKQQLEIIIAQNKALGEYNSAKQAELALAKLLEEEYIFSMIIHL